MSALEMWSIYRKVQRYDLRRLLLLTGCGAFLHGGFKASRLPEIIMEEVTSLDGSRRMKLPNSYKPQAWLELNTKQAAKESLSKDNRLKKGFAFGSTLALQGVSPGRSYSRKIRRHPLWHLERLFLQKSRLYWQSWCLL